MLILSEKWITTKCQPPDLRAWVADRAAVAPLGPDNPGGIGVGGHRGQGGIGVGGHRGRGHRGQTDFGGIGVRPIRGHRGQTDLEFFVNETRAALGSGRLGVRPSFKLT